MLGEAQPGVRKQTLEIKALLLLPQPCLDSRVTPIAKIDLEREAPVPVPRGQVQLIVS